jgi:hypothetical protein
MLACVLFNRDALPHLGLVSWEKIHLIDLNLFSSRIVNNAASFNVQHLKMNSIKLDEELKFDSFSTPNLWSLCTLNVRIDWATISSSPLCSNLLRWCAHSLETLIWKSACGSSDAQSFDSYLWRSLVSQNCEIFTPFDGFLRFKRVTYPPSSVTPSTGRIQHRSLASMAFTFEESSESAAS